MNKINKCFINKRFMFNANLNIRDFSNYVICYECNRNNKLINKIENSDKILGKELIERSVIKVETPKNIFSDKAEEQMAEKLIRGEGMRYSAEELVKLVRSIEKTLIEDYGDNGFHYSKVEDVFKAINCLGKAGELKGRPFVVAIAEKALKKLHKVVRCDDDHLHEAIEENLKKISESKKVQLIGGLFSCPVLFDKTNQEVFLKLYENKLDKVSASEGKGLMKFVFDNFASLSNELSDRDKGIFFVTIGSLMKHKDDTVRDSVMHFMSHSGGFFRKSDY